MKKIIVIAVWFVNCCFSPAQSISGDEKEMLMARTKELLNEHFIHTDKARLVSDSLHASAFYDVNDRAEFLKRLNEKLFHYTNDKHLSVEYHPGYAEEPENNKHDPAGAEREAYGFSKIEIFSGNIGYLGLKYFSDTSRSMQTALQSLAILENTAAFIMDLRGNTGGSGSMLQFLCSFFLASDNLLLQIMYRSGDTVTLKTYPDKNRATYQKPLYILCDRQTYSAAEGFIFIMKNRGRATVIGETTSGAGNIAGPYFLSQDYIITIPVGKIIDPLIEEGWEGTGVSPDINAGTSDALEIAKKLAAKKE